jgi:hypothetical protein
MEAFRLHQRKKRREGIQCTGHTLHESAGPSNSVHFSLSGVWLNLFRTMEHIELWPLI